MLQVIDYKQILSQVPFLKQTYAMKQEDRFLLQKLELQKKEQLLDERIRNFQQDQKQLEEDQRNIAIEKDNVQKEKDNVKNMIDNFNKAKADQATYDNKIDALAAQMESMPPNSAVSILSRQDDMMAIDVLRRMEARAQSAGNQSTVPYLLSLMDPDQAARIQRKMLQ
jgi:DNA repair exonuclease SbcCD ATPase subunit